GHDSGLYHCDNFGNDNNSIDNNWAGEDFNNIMFRNPFKNSLQQQGTAYLDKPQWDCVRSGGPCKPPVKPAFSIFRVFSRFSLWGILGGLGASPNSIAANQTTPPTKVTDWIAVILSSIAIVLSVTTLLMSRHFNEISTRRAARENHIKMLFDIGKTLVDNPRLWCIYDNHPLNKTRQNSPEDDAKREAFIYQHLNLFELTHNYYLHMIKRDRYDQDFWESWNYYIR